MSQTVGVIGAGRMGLPLIGHLARKGFRSFATDLDASKRIRVEERGAAWSANAAELAASCDVVLVCVGFDREVRALLEDPELASAARPGAIYAVLSTVHPKTVQALAAGCAGKNLCVVDATMCRGGSAADAGTLLSFVGGEAAVVERLRPVLAAFSSDIVHTGGVGSAQVAKAVNNLIMWACLVADHEGLALAQRYGIDAEKLRQALLMSSAANNALANWGMQTMAWAEDDMAIVAEMAADCAIALPQAEVTRELCRVLKPRRYKLEAYGR
ncbi:MAG TPA: NAD(P)-dependent oxidoreductase [Burkholderiales bacterium]|jgi:3-hydroxyisobutyrate dehydrogenase-like beta-hydroxyacid dehydrogenase